MTNEPGKYRETPELVSRLMSQLSPVVDAFIDSLSDAEVDELFEWARDSKNLIPAMQKALSGKLQ